MHCRAVFFSLHGILTQQVAERWRGDILPNSLSSALIAGLALWLSMEPIKLLSMLVKAAWQMIQQLLAPISAMFDALCHLIGLVN